MATLNTRLTELLGIEHPILLGAMGSASGGKLAGAVTQAGGMGFIGSGYADANAIRKGYGEAGNMRVGVGFINWALDRNPDVLDIGLEYAPPAVILSFGDPTPYVKRAQTAGSLVICQVQSVDKARQAADAGADIIVAQGKDAGGHSGEVRGTIGLVPAVVDTVAPIPVVAAGGIGDGRGLAAALVLGAEGVLMGTRFAASQESDWSDAMKQEAVAAGGDNTGQTRVFDIVRKAPWPTEFPGRAVKNDFFLEWHGQEVELTKNVDSVANAFDATDPNDLNTRVLWAGESVDMVKDIPSARDIVEQTVEQAVEALRLRTP